MIMNNKVSYWERVNCDVNCFKWRILPLVFKPNGWEDMGVKEQYKNKLHKTVYKISILITTTRGRSRAHWIYVLKRTEDQWLVWWLRKGQHFKWPTKKQHNPQPIVMVP